jgi:hypothetical protein
MDRSADLGDRREPIEYEEDFEEATGLPRERLVA